MFIGFDYGTANCSVAVMRENTPQLLTLENGSALLPSMLCAPTREAVSEWLYRHHDVPTHSDENQALLRRAIAANRDEDIEVLRNSVQFGLASLHQYVEDPEEVYFVKSPKSFLGASGLKPQQVALFEDLVCAMMLHIKLQAESQLPEQIDQAVIGRPINFQGLGGDDANAQAQGILERAALRAGFRTAHVLGATGGRLDHELSNIHLMRAAKDAGLFMEIYDAKNRIFLLTPDDEEHSVFRKTDLYGKYVSFLPLTEKVLGITLDGFKYPLHNKDISILENPSLCVSNEVPGESAKISFREGILICVESGD